MKTATGIGRLLRSARACALLAACCLVLAGSLALAASQEGGAARQKKPFPHRSHVADTWYYRGGKYPGDPKPGKQPGDISEVARDCRGCHDFGARDASGTRVREEASPMALCRNCHYGEVLSFEVQPGFEKGLRAGSGTQSSFEHLDHDDMACRACHQQSAEDPDSFGGATGVPACRSCHTDDASATREHEPLFGRQIDLRSVRQGFLDWLNRDPSMRAPGRGPYPHDRHIAPERRKSSAACADCHGEVGAATALDLHQKEYSAGECARCHVQSDGKPVQVETAFDRRPSATAATFSHADHLRVREAKEDLAVVQAGARQRVASGGCLECHEHATTPSVQADGTVLPASYALRADRDDFEGCMQCHDAPAFRAPHHGRWTDCGACHESGTTSHEQFRTSRPSVAVDRLAPGAVRFSAPPQGHPGLAGSVADDCSACHRAPLPVFPSRISGQRFQHATHLPAKPDGSECVACHADVARSTGPESIGAAWDATKAALLPSEERASFDLASCQGCHPGVRIDESALPAPASRAAVRFDHAAHLAKGRDPRDGKALSCASCHEFDPARRDAPLGVRPKAQDCTQCHAHDEQNAARTGGVGAAEAASCVLCHKDALPSTTEPVEVLRARIALQGTQHHPPGRACEDCHLSEAAGGLAPVSAVLSSFPAGRQQHRDGRPSGCTDCHWAKAPPSFPDQAVDARQRQTLGNSLNGYPGQAGAR